MYAVLVNGEVYGYAKDATDAAWLEADALCDVEVDDSVDIVDDAMPCRMEKTMFGTSVICVECGNYCSCVACAA